MSNRRNFLKTTTTAALGTLAFPALGANVGAHKRLRKEDVILGHGDYQYKLISDWGKVSSVRNPILNCHEMVMDSKGRLIMLGDNTQNN
ncbi:MAG: twin-arginine translocation signal domain-containing protein, partial [Bacteroidota bacterium]